MVCQVCDVKLVLVMPRFLSKGTSILVSAHVVRATEGHLTTQGHLREVTTVLLI